jgi:hypothetical protein
VGLTDVERVRLAEFHLEIFLQFRQHNQRLAQLHIYLRVEPGSNRLVFGMCKRTNAGQPPGVNRACQAQVKIMLGFRMDLPSEFDPLALSAGLG